MKKILIYFIIISIFLIFIKYWLSNYTIYYKIDGYNVSEVYKNNRFYYEISNDEYIYNFDYYKKRNFSKTKINKIEKIEDENINCIYPSISGVSTYPLCYKDNEFIDYHLIDSELLENYKKEEITAEKSSKDFVYYNSLNNNEYVALWNYKGYIVINGNNYNNVELFDKDKYDNSLAYIINEIIYMPDNSQEHEYSNLVGLNLTDLSNEIFDIGYNIDYDSYVVGNIDNYLYIFDNKYSILYEIDVKNYETKIIGNNEKGFVKYENGKFISCSKNDYKVNKIKYNNKESNYKYNIDNGVYKTINENEKIKQKIIKTSVDIISNYENILYYRLNDIMYKYNPEEGSKEIFYNYEMKFNSDNVIFVYNK